MPHNHERRRVLLAGIGAVGAMAIARSARAATCGDPGPLAPTGPTMRNLYDKIAFTDQGLAEARRPLSSFSGSATALYVIDTPGVVYMTENVNGVAGMSGVEITSDNVEFECDGFIFIGVPGTRACITTPSPQRAIVIYDCGFVTWQETAVDLSNSVDCYVEESWFVQCDASSSSLGHGACSLGDGGTIDDCNVMLCTAGGLRVGVNGIIEETVMRDSTGSMSSVGPATMEDNFVVNCPGSFIAIDTGGVVTGNRLVSSGGISVGGDSVVAENDLSSCSSGINVGGSGTVVEENHIASCVGGVRVISPSQSVLIDGNNVTRCTGTCIKLEIGAAGLVVRNTVSTMPGGVTYDIAAGSSYGSIVNAVGVGDLGGSGTLLDPWSNFEY